MGVPISYPCADLTSDVLGEHSEVDVSIYDRSNQETFLGHVRICPLLKYNQNQTVIEGWFPLEGRGGHGDVTGEIKLRMTFEKTAKRHYGPHDFEVLRLIGKGEHIAFSRVLKYSHYLNRHFWSGLPSS